MQPGKFTKSVDSIKTYLYVSLRMNKSSSKNGRPKTKGGLRNFKFRADLDSFLVKESDRTGKDMTAIIEHLLVLAKSIKPSVRDAELAKAFRILREEAK